MVWQKVQQNLHFKRSHSESLSLSLSVPFGCPMMFLKTGSNNVKLLTVGLHLMLGSRHNESFIFTGFEMIWNPLSEVAKKDLMVNWAMNENLAFQIELKRF